MLLALWKRLTEMGLDVFLWKACTVFRVLTLKRVHDPLGLAHAPEEHLEQSAEVSLRSL